MNGTITGLKAKPSGVCEVNVKVGDMVKRNEIDPRGNDFVRIGIIVDTNGCNTYKVRWLGDYGTFWDNAKRLEVISESR
jgi:hypothetical protein